MPRRVAYRQRKKQNFRVCELCAEKKPMDEVMPYYMPGWRSAWQNHYWLCEQCKAPARAQWLEAKTASSIAWSEQ